jgi:hypothetical protein
MTTRAFGRQAAQDGAEPRRAQEREEAQIRRNAAEVEDADERQPS